MCGLVDEMDVHHELPATACGQEAVNRPLGTVMSRAVGEGGELMAMFPQQD